MRLRWAYLAGLATPLVLLVPLVARLRRRCAPGCPTCIVWRLYAGASRPVAR